ncbi:MAG TPA: histidine kinase [Ferruginibacter sp.]|jgi:two-component system LytT family sensor kinase|nr:histidine kinase [Ferruginibacter sp.]
MKLIKKILLHILCWLVYYAALDIEELIIDPSIKSILAGLTSYGLLACLFYFVVYFLSPKLLAKGKYWDFFTAIFLLLFVYNFIRIYQLKLYDYIYPVYSLTHTYIYGAPVSFMGILPRTFYFYSSNMAIYIGYCFWMNTKALNKSIIEKGKLALEQERQFSALKTESIQSELTFLQNQINPHFLYNTLNLFYAKMVPYNLDLAGGILTLSDIMRYALTSHIQHSAGQKTLLSDEVEHLKNVIKINRLRFPNSMYLDFEIDGSIDNVHMLPLVLITFAENIFKHGAVHLAEYPAKIKLTVADGFIRYQTTNKIKLGMKEPSTGIGLANVKKRLQHTYGDKFNLVTNDDGIYYSVELTIHSNI